MIHPPPPPPPLTRSPSLYKGSFVVVPAVCVSGLVHTPVLLLTVLPCCRLQDLFQQEKGRKRLSVPPSPGRHRQTEESKVCALWIQ